MTPVTQLHIITGISAAAAQADFNAWTLAHLDCQVQICNIVETAGTWQIFVFYITLTS